MSPKTPSPMIATLLILGGTHLASAQGLNRAAHYKETRDFPDVRTDLIHLILMGAPNGCPYWRSSSRLNRCRSVHLTWGTRKSRTRGSVSRISETASA